MAKGYVYFFKHIGLSPIKIGMTTSETVTKRFESFKTYAPYGAEIVGYIESENPYKLEQLLHSQFREKRLHGEFFEITIDVVDSLILKHSSNKINKIKQAFNLWLSTTDIEKYDSDSLIEMLESNSVNSENKNDYENYVTNTLELYFNLFPKSTMNGSNFVTATDIYEIINNKIDSTIPIKKIGSILKKLGVSRIKNKGVYGYVIEKKFLPFQTTENE